MKKIKPAYSKLNIGCGYNKLKGFVNIDKSKKVKPDIEMDIEKGISFLDNSFKYIYSKNCLEHIRPHYWEFVLNEIARVSKDGCILELILPSDTSPNRTHCFHYKTFDDLSFESLLQNSERDYYSDLGLIKLSRIPIRIKRMFWRIFPFLRGGIYFKFKIVKK